VGGTGQLAVLHGLGKVPVGVILGLVGAEGAAGYEYFEAFNFPPDQSLTSRVEFLAATVDTPFDGEFRIHVRHAATGPVTVRVRWFAVAA
jgi:hypothetical protein